MSGGIMRRFQILIAATVVYSMVAVMLPGVPALGADSGADELVEPLAATYPADVWESIAGGDDAKVDARYLSSIPGPGTLPYTEAHTLDTATGTTGDEDWYYFTVSASDVTQKYAYLIEADTYYEGTDTVIEVYGPGLAWTPSDPNLGIDAASIVANDDGHFMYRGSSVPFLPYKSGGAGTYYFRIRGYTPGGGGNFTDCAGPYTMRIKRGNLQRIYGADRMGTAIEISKEYQPNRAQNSQDKAVVLANAYNFPDALAGSVLAGISDGPVLLTPQDHLPNQVKAEIGRTGVKRVYVLGGESAVGPAVVSAIQAMSPAPAVIRVQGDDRYHTAAEIANQAHSDDSGYGETVSNLAIVVSGENFPDALAASAVSVHGNVPILLTTQGALHPDTEDIITHLGITDVVVAGGTAAVSTNVTNRLATILSGAGHVHRVWGGNRYETAKELAVWACDLDGPGSYGDGQVGTPSAPTILNDLHQSNVGVASGESFPDALAGGALCGWEGHPLLLNPKASVSDYIFEEHEFKLPAGDTDYFSDIGGQALLTSRLFGGSAAVSDSTFVQLDQWFGFESP